MYSLTAIEPKNPQLRFKIKISQWLGCYSTCAKYGGSGDQIPVGEYNFLKFYQLSTHLEQIALLAFMRPHRIHYKVILH